MAMTPAEKQRRYRERHLGVDGKKERLQCFVSVQTKAKLMRLARYRGYTVTELIETLVAAAENTLVRSLPDEDIIPYLDGKLPPRLTNHRSEPTDKAKPGDESPMSATGA